MRNAQRFFVVFGRKNAVYRFFSENPGTLYTKPIRGGVAIL